MTNNIDTQNYQFNYLITIEPLGFLYGSAGRFLSPENLVGRSGQSFPPSSVAVSGIFANKYREIDKEHHFNLKDFTIAGPFWGKTDDVITNSNFYVPTPLNYLVKNGEIQHKLHWNSQEKKWLNDKNKAPADKFEKGTWIPVNDWENPQKVEKSPWKFSPHLHPRLALDQRRVLVEKDDIPLEEKKGSLFLENAVQMSSDTCLVYLCSHKLESGWYRFGGEGHLVEIECKLITKDSTIRQLLDTEIEDKFALISSAVWGSNRLSLRTPIELQKDELSQSNQNNSDSNNKEVWDIETIFTSRPYTHRYRLGGALSRGRYSVPAGTIYVLKNKLSILENGLSTSWLNWNESWFPYEGYSLKRWGCGLALPIK